MHMKHVVKMIHSLYVCTSMERVNFEGGMHAVVNLNRSEQNPAASGNVGKE